jgi:hypothetical protein
MLRLHWRAGAAAGCGHLLGSRAWLCAKTRRFEKGPALKAFIRRSQVLRFYREMLRVSSRALYHYHEKYHILSNFQPHFLTFGDKVDCLSNAKLPPSIRLAVPVDMRGQQVKLHTASCKVILQPGSLGVVEWGRWTGFH